MITRKDIERVTREVVAEDPERDNGGLCCYRDEDGRPNCIAAVVLDRLGVDIGLLVESVPVDAPQHRLNFVDRRGLRWLRQLQSEADGLDGTGDTPWVEALGEVSS